MSTTARADVAIVGAGIVGLSCALHLMRRGRSCVLIDPAGPGSETSFGNAGSISVGNVLPQSTPGIARRALRMLFDPQAPLKLDARSLPRTAGWLLAFLHAGRRARVLQIVDALHAINHASRAAWLDLADDIEARELIAESGYLHVYSDPATFENNRWERELMQARGVAFDVLDTAALRDLEPGLGPGFAHGVFQPASLALLDPGALALRLCDALLARGAQLRLTQARSLQPSRDGVRIDGDDGAIEAGEVVVATGAWSPALLRGFGRRIPIVPARGYHRMFPAQPRAAQRPVLWSERYMVVSPMRGGVRMTSIKEITALDRPPRYEYIRARDADARALFPALDAPAISEWCGLRPCTPDSLPILDRVAQRVWLASGHGHLGITQGPVSGRLMAEMICGETPLLSMSPYRLDRFA